MLIARCALGVLLGAVLVNIACSVDDRNPEVGQEFSRNLMYSVQATPQVTPLPAGVSSGPQVIDMLADSGPSVVRPGDTLSFPIAWQGGTITSVNMSFAENQYFSIPVPNAGTQTEGLITIPATLLPGVCDELEAICHEVEYFEQVVTADGVASVARALQLILDCEGQGCQVAAGTKQPGDPCASTTECIPGSICFNRYCVGEGVLRISLAFTVDSDFDLHVLTPAGNEIYWYEEAANGGVLDVDQCILECGTGAHVENVVFDGTALPGEYQVWVQNFGEGRAAGDFTIEVAGDVSRTFTGSLPAVENAESERFSFTR